MKINFGKIAEELKNNDLKICFVDDIRGIFIQDDSNNLYKMNNSYPPYLDNLISNKIIAEFKKVNIALLDFEKDLWDYVEVNKFIKRQCL